MDLCQRLRQQLAETEAQIRVVQEALDATRDPDEARQLTERLIRLQSQRTELRIAINQHCPAVAAAAPAPAKETAEVIDASRKLQSKNTALLRKAAPKKPSR